LSIASDQSFAAFWLSTWLYEFQKLNPKISQRVFASDDEASCLSDDAQLCILHGDGFWPGYQSYKPFDEKVFPVCSPDYIKGNPKDDWHSWLLSVELLDLDDSHWNWMNWRSWVAGFKIEEPVRNRQLQINSYPLLIEAARRSQGVALGWDCLIDEQLESGQLVRPIDQSLSTRRRSVN
jgi:LysR family glycine cleavage system transcriptional activator